MELVLEDHTEVLVVRGEGDGEAAELEVVVERKGRG